MSGSRTPDHGGVCARSSADDISGSQPLKLLEIHRGRPIQLNVKVLVPVTDHPNFNFVGKLLGPKGSSLKRLQEVTQTRMAVLGKGSMRNKKKEEELRCAPDPRLAHLRHELHVDISAFAPAAEAHARIAHALAELRRFLVPDYYDDIRQQQLRELALMGGRLGGSEPVSPASSAPASPSGQTLSRSAHLLPFHRTLDARAAPERPYGLPPEWFFPEPDERPYDDGFARAYVSESGKEMAVIEEKKMYDDTFAPMNSERCRDEWGWGPALPPRKRGHFRAFPSLSRAMPYFIPSGERSALQLS